MSESQRIVTRENLFDFFHEQVDSAVSNHGNPLSQEGVYYLSNLLGERGRRGTEGDDALLVDLHLQARQGGRAQAIQAYRELGDKALYITGFFPKSLSRKTVGVSYYQDMGSSAYHCLAQILGDGEQNRRRQAGRHGLADIDRPVDHHAGDR